MLASVCFVFLIERIFAARFKFGTDKKDLNLELIPIIRFGNAHPCYVLNDLA